MKNQNENDTLNFIKFFGIHVIIFLAAYVAFILQTRNGDPGKTFIYFMLSGIFVFFLLSNYLTVKWFGENKLAKAIIFIVTSFIWFFLALGIIVFYFDLGPQWMTDIKDQFWSQDRACC